MSVFPNARFIRLIVAAFLTVSFALSATPAMAQTPEDAKKVLALISDATKAFEDKDYATAEEKFAAAYEIYPDPVLLYRVGLAAEKQEKYRVALASFQKFIAAMPDDETAVKLKGRLAALEAKVPPVLTVTSLPEGAEVRIGSAEGDVLGTTPLETEVEPGSTTLFISYEGYETTERTVELEAAGSEEVDVRLVQRTTPEEEGASGMAIWGWTTMGIGAALLATGATFTILTQGKVTEVNDYDKRAPDASPADLQELKDSAESNYQTSLIAYGVGGAFVATGIVLLILDSSGDEGDESAVKFDAGVLPDRAWVGLRGTF